MEVPGGGEALADDLGADDLAVDLDQGAVGLVVEGDLADAEHDERVGHAGDSTVKARSESAAGRS